ncbi:metallophosphoesterase [bacterium]|nr:metallophosphoesterase [bacterium]
MTPKRPRIARVASTLRLLLLVVFGAFGVWLGMLGGQPEPPWNPSGDVGPAPVGSETVTIIALADLKARSAVLLRAYEAARAENAAAIVIGGDLVEQNSRLEFAYAGFLLGRRPPGIPAFDAIGNHEGFDRHDNLSRERYERLFGPSQSWFRTRGVLFVSIDTSDEKSFPEEKAREVDAILSRERPRSDHAVLVSHVPPLVGKVLRDKRGNTKQLPEEDSRRIFSLVEKHGIELVLAGHYHGYSCEKRGSTTYLVSGGGGGSLDGPDELHHFLKVRLGPGALEHEVVRVDDGAGIEWVRHQVLREALWLVPVIVLVFVGLSIVLQRLTRQEAT